MRVNEQGYITQITVKEAIEQLNALFMGPLMARGNGKSIMSTNQLTAWNKVLEYIDALEKEIVGYKCYAPKKRIDTVVIDELHDDNFDCGYHEHAKEKHDERVADTPNRIEFAKKQFESNNIDYDLKNESTGHFHCWRKSDNKLFQFYAGTGKITGVSNERGIHALIKILTK